MPRGLSLFCGCGGLDKGFEDLGIDIVAAIDNNKWATETYNRNLNGPAICMDVLSSQFVELLSDIGSIDILLGGFPCQGFSKSGPKLENDPRNSLFLAMVQAAQKLEPSVVIAENVDGIQQNYGGVSIKTIMNEFTNLGYKGEVRIVDFAAYGLPQHRRRAIFVFTKQGSPSNLYPQQTHEYNPRNGEFRTSDSLPLFLDASLAPPNTMVNCLEDLKNEENVVNEHVFFKNYPQEYNYIMQNIKMGQKLCDVRKAETSVHSWHIPEFFGEVSHHEIEVLEAISTYRRHKRYGDIPNGNPMTPRNVSDLIDLDIERVEIIFSSLTKKKYIKPKLWGWDLANATFNSGIFKRPEWNALSPTVLTNFYNPRFFLHPLYNRPFTVREAARLQSFPDSFSILEPGSSSSAIKEAFRQIGNAVPPLFSASLASQVIRHLNHPNGIDKKPTTHTFIESAAA
jgi:DNA (cytosine-5)-methyltransferase 1